MAFMACVKWVPTNVYLDYLADVQNVNPTTSKDDSFFDNLEDKASRQS